MLHYQVLLQGDQLLLDAGMWMNVLESVALWSVQQISGHTAVCDTKATGHSTRHNALHRYCTFVICSQYRQVCRTAASCTKWKHTGVPAAASCYINQTCLSGDWNFRRILARVQVWPSHSWDICRVVLLKDTVHRDVLVVKVLYRKLKTRFYS